MELVTLQGKGTSVNLTGITLWLQREYTERSPQPSASNQEEDDDRREETDRRHNLIVEETKGGPKASKEWTGMGLDKLEEMCIYLWKEIKFRWP